MHYELCIVLRTSSFLRFLQVYWTTVGKAPTASGVKQIFNNYKTWSPETYVSINFGANSALYTNETNGATTKPYITSVTQASHYGNGAFAKLVAPAVVEKMKSANVIKPLEK